jgi:hypothetical protein
MKALLVFAFVLSLGCLTAAGGVYVVLKEEMKDLEWQLELAQNPEPARESAPSPQDSPEWVLEMKARVSALEEKVATLQKGAPAAAGRANPAAPLGLGLPLPGAPGGDAESAEVPGRAGGPDAAPARKEELERKVKDLESKLGEVQKRLEEDKEEKKPKFSQFAARLGLDDNQKQATSDILRRGKEELLEHLQKPLSDGKILINEFAEIMFQTSQNPKEAEKKGGQIFLRLFSEKVPGTEKTYIETIGELNGRIRSDMKACMNDEQKKKYDEWSPDPTDIELEDDPINRYLMDYIKRRKEEEEGG